MPATRPRSFRLAPHEFQRVERIADHLHITSGKSRRARHAAARGEARAASPSRCRVLRTPRPAARRPGAGHRHPSSQSVAPATSPRSRSPASPSTSSRRGSRWRSARPVAAGPPRPPSPCTCATTRGRLPARHDRGARRGRPDDRTVADLPDLVVERSRARIGSRVAREPVGRPEAARAAAPARMMTRRTSRDVFTDVIDPRARAGLIPVELAREIIKKATEESVALSALPPRGHVDEAVRAAGSLRAGHRLLGRRRHGAQADLRGGLGGREADRRGDRGHRPRPDRRVRRRAGQPLRRAAPRDRRRDRPQARRRRAHRRRQARQLADLARAGGRRRRQRADRRHARAQGAIYGDLEAAISIVEDDGFDATAIGASGRLRRRLRRARNTIGDLLGDVSTTAAWDLAIEPTPRRGCPRRTWPWSASGRWPSSAFARTSPLRCSATA